MTEQGRPQVAEGLTTRKRKVLGLVLVFAGIGLYFPGFWMFLVLDDYLTKETVKWLVSMLLPLVWALPVIGLGLHARTHKRTVWWAATGWFPVLGPLFALVAMRLDRSLAGWNARKVIRTVCAGTLTVVFPLLLLAMVIPGFRAYEQSGHTQQAPPSTRSTHMSQGR